MSADLRQTPAQTEVGEPTIEPRRRLELLHDCRHIVLSHLTRFIGDALDRLSVELTITAMKEAGRETQQALLDALSLVRVHRNDIEYAFQQSVSEIFERRLFEKDAPETARDDGAELALVSEDEIESRIAVERLIRRSRDRLDPDEVLGIRARLAALLDRDWFDEDDYPASPEFVFEALQRSLDDLSPAAEVRSALLKAFEPHVTASLNEVYSTVNERLRSQRVLPKIRPRAVTAPDSLRPDAQADAAQSSKAQGANGAVGADGDASGRGANERAGDPFDDLIRQITAGQPAARQTAARMLADPGMFGMADLPMPSVEAPLIEALHTMQSAPARGTPVDGTALAAQLLDQARNKGSSLDQLTVEIVSLVFDYIYADRRLPDSVKQQLLRLQVVAVKAALIDRSFFARRQHPMRRLIDRISDLATDPDSDVEAGSTLASGIADIVDWILAHFDNDLATFEEAMARFDVLAHAERERHETRLAELTRAAVRLDALAVAEEEASAEIALRIDPVTPAFVREFLYHTWARALARARVDGDCGGASWTDALHSAELLIWSVAPKAPEDIARLASLLPRLIGPLMKGLQAIGEEQSLRERFFNELLQWHTRAIQDAKLNTARPSPAAVASAKVRIAPDGTLRFDAALAGDGRSGARLAAHTARVVANPDVDSLECGDQLSVTEDDGMTRTFRLAWISPTHKLYVLTRFPDVGRSFSRNELIAMFAAGRARRLEAHRTVDRAIDAIARSEANSA